MFYRRNKHVCMMAMVALLMLTLGCFLGVGSALAGGINLCAEFSNIDVTVNGEPLMPTFSSYAYGHTTINEYSPIRFYLDYYTSTPGLFWQYQLNNQHSTTDSLTLAQSALTLDDKAGFFYIPTIPMASQDAHQDISFQTPNPLPVLNVHIGFDWAYQMEFTPTAETPFTSAYWTGSAYVYPGSPLPTQNIFAFTKRTDVPYNSGIITGTFDMDFTLGPAQADGKPILFSDQIRIALSLHQDTSGYNPPYSVPIPPAILLLGSGLLGLAGLRLRKA
jgi:hypothetical protein